MCTPLPEDAVEMSIDLTKDDQVGNNKYEALSSGVYDTFRAVSQKSCSILLIAAYEIQYFSHNNLIDN